MIDPAELCEQALYDPDDIELWDKTAYAMGFHEPNYPMPATPMKVGITPTMVWVMPIGNAGALDVWFKLVAWKYRKSCR